MQIEVSQVTKSKKKSVIIAISVIIVFAMLFSLVLTMYNNESQAVTTQFLQEESTKSGYILITAKSFSVDPVKGEMSTRLQFTTNGDLTGDDNMLSKDLILYVNGSTGKTQIPFKKGEAMNPTDVVIDIYGNVGAYPFDSHDGLLSIGLMSEEKDANGNVISSEDVPFTVDYTSSLAGYKIDPTEGEDSTTGYVEINLNVTRAATALTFAIFIMCLELLLALSAVGATYVWLRGRKIEVGLFGWMGGLLFALVPLRNAMPAVPPVGVLSDIIAFFWAEIIVAVCLVVSVATWLKRGSAEGKAK